MQGWKRSEKAQGREGGKRATSRTWRLQNCMMCAATVRSGEDQMVCGRETEEKSVAWGFTCMFLC